MSMKPFAALPPLRIEVNGLPLPPPLGFALYHLRVEQRLSQPTYCDLRFENPPPALATSPLLQPGAALRIIVENQPVPLFVGQVAAVEYGYDRHQTISVQAYDNLYPLGNQGSSRGHAQVTVADLLNEFLLGSGLSVIALANSPLWERLIQHSQSNLELLQELAERCGLYFMQRDQSVYLFSLAGLEAPVDLTFGANLYRARLTVNSQRAPSGVTALAWDTGHVETHTGQSQRPRSPNVRATNGHSAGSRLLVNTAAPNVAHAEAIAQAELDYYTACEVLFSGEAEGDPRLMPGTIINVQGVAPDICGTYVLTSVNHSISAQGGYLCELATQPPAPANRPLRTAITVGLVTAINDPDGCGRVKVALPTYDQVETDWIAVMSIGAGAKKGLMILPAVGDQVLVLFTQSDPAQSVVLGGLYGTKATPDEGVTGGAVSRFSLVTPGGQIVRLDDQNHLLRLENQDGSFIELAPGGVKFHAAANLDIEAPGSSLTIRANSVNFVQG